MSRRLLLLVTLERSANGLVPRVLAQYWEQEWIEGRFMLGPSGMLPDFALWTELLPSSRSHLNQNLFSSGTEY